MNNNVQPTQTNSMTQSLTVQQHTQAIQHYPVASNILQYPEMEPQNLTQTPTPFENQIHSQMQHYNPHTLTQQSQAYAITGQQQGQYLQPAAYAQPQQCQCVQQAPAMPPLQPVHTVPLPEDSRTTTPALPYYSETEESDSDANDDNVPWQEERGKGRKRARLQGVRTPTPKKKISSKELLTLYK